MSSTKAKAQSRGASAPATVNDDATAPIARCAKTGRPLDPWGLPMNGPARAAALEELGMPDPNEDPDAWAKQLPVDTAVLASTQPVDLPGIGPVDAAMLDQLLGEKE